MSGPFFVAAKTLGALAWGEAKSKNNGSAKPVSVNFDMWRIPFVAVDVVKDGRTNFSHALVAKVKKIMKNLAASQSAGGGSASPKTM